MVTTTNHQQTPDTTTTWRIAPSDTHATFTVRQHLCFARRLTGIGRTVVGRFVDVTGTIVLDERRHPACPHPP